MKNLVKIALRNTTRQKKRTILLGGAIAFGIFIITLLNGFTAGLADNVRDNFSRIFGGQIFISGTVLTRSGRPVNVIEDDSKLIGIVESLEGEIKKYTRRSRAMGEIIFNSRSVVQRIDGVDWQDDRNFAVSLPIVKGSIDSVYKRDSIILPVSTAKKLGVEVGESVLVRLSTVTGQKNVGDFVVIATVKDQEGFGISTAYTSLDYLNELLQLKPDEYQILSIYVRDINKMDAIANKIYKRLKEIGPVETRETGEASSPEAMRKKTRKSFAMLMGGGPFSSAVPEKKWVGTKFSVITLNDMMSQVVSMVNVLNTTGLVIFIILLIITMVGITNSYRMTMLERTREIGTMRAIGVHKSGIRDIFLLEALFVSIAGALVGIILAFGAMFIISRIPFGTDSMMWIFLKSGRVGFKVIPREILLNLVILVGLSILAALGPARKAAKLEPAAALRTEF